jgi:hypothetical protein
MKKYQPVFQYDISAIERPRRTECHEPRMLFAKIEAGPTGFDSRTFECQKMR